MAEFECKVYRLTIEEHPNADAIELAAVGDYRSIVKKGQFKTGDLGVYIPEGAVCPEWLISHLGLEGRLAGKQKNRVKAIKLRGILSQGLIFGLRGGWNGGTTPAYVCTPEDAFEVKEGDVVTDFLEVTKYEPPIPTHMGGEVFNAHGLTLLYDIENFKKYPDILKEGEFVSITEKIHGTWCCFSFHPDCDTYIITSKGLSGKGLAFKLNGRNETNLYVRALKLTEDASKKDVIARGMEVFGVNQPFYILGEVYGQGVQDLHYGMQGVGFRVFDIYFGYPGIGNFADSKDLPGLCKILNIEMVPVLHFGEFSKELMLELTDGTETVSGDEKNIREGIVIKPHTERRDLELGRVALKSVSEKYLLRKGGTEFN